MASTLNQGFFRHELQTLLKIVTQDPILENIWLLHLSFLEEQAAVNIVNNIVPETPEGELRSIIEHVKDEHRHARKLREMQEILGPYPDHKYYVLEKEWLEIGKNFLISFFNEPLLRKVSHRYAAYVHGAQTIERLPFRVYDLYLSMTHSNKVQKELPEIINDEFRHIELGRRLFEGLSPKERRPLSAFYQLEENYSLIYLRRMNTALKKIWGLSGVTICGQIEEKIIFSKKAEVSFNAILSLIEEEISPFRHGLLRAAITFDRAGFRRDEHFLKLEPRLLSLATPYLTSLKEARINPGDVIHRLNDLYGKLIYQTNNIALHFAYFSLLNVPIKEFESSALKESKEREYKLWEDLCGSFLAMDL